MTPQEFKQWRNRFGLTQEDAGKLLDRNARSIYRLETARDDVPIDIMLACEGVELSEMIGSNKNLILNLIPRAGDEHARGFLRRLLKVDPVIERFVANRIKKEMADVEKGSDGLATEDPRAKLAATRERFASGRIDERQAIMDILDTILTHDLPNAGT